jgi:peroxiredoxin Q/BCP
MAQTAKKSKAKNRTKSRLAPKRKAKKMPKRKTAKKTKAKVAKKKTKKVTAKTKARRPKKAIVTRTISKTTTPELSIAHLAVGDAAPNFALTDQAGKTHKLSDYLGKKIVLYFYPKDDTPGCTKEACSFRDNLPTFEGTDAVILGVSFDDQSSHDKFVTKYQLNFPLLSDANKDTANAYGVYVDKNMYGKIYKGIERSTFVIDRNGKIAAIFRKVSVDGHTQEVLNALSQIS